jgi:hypothetical protein
VRLDVDGWYPQMMASGAFSTDLTVFGGYVEWAANLKETPTGGWSGEIWSKFGDEFLLPQIFVTIEVRGAGRRSVMPAQMTITFSGGGGPTVSRQLQYASPYFRSADIEWDLVEQATEVTSFNTGSRADRPASVPVETLSVVEVFSRTGVDLRTSSGAHQIPLSLAGGDAVWSDSELEDVMKQYWSRYKSQAQWAIWFLFAGLHEDAGVRGIMFDHFSKSYKRRGGAVFNDWWTQPNEPFGPDETGTNIHRRRFVTACHETGHCFDLIHSWEKPASGWWPLGSEPYALSFMNNPEASVGAKEFFDGFEYRFSNLELSFIRHAPEVFVEMGGPYYGDSVADAAYPASCGWMLQVSVSNPQRLFDFLEPVMLDVTLTNTSDRPRVIDEGVLQDGHNLAVAVGKGGTMTTLCPFAIACLAPTWRVLQPGESIARSVFASAGSLGWLIAEPGPYEVRAMLNTASAKARAEPLALRVAMPRTREEEVIAQDFFTDDVARTLAFGGSTVRPQANTTLERIADQMHDRQVARHAQLALGLPKLKARKQLRLTDGEAPVSSVAGDGGAFVTTKADPEGARRLIAAALTPGEGMTTFSEVFGEELTTRFGDWLHRGGDPSAVGGVRSGRHRRRAAGQP